jgi:hypothetical protein
LLGEHPDSAAVAQRVADIENIHHVEAQDDRAPPRDTEFARHAGIDLGVGRVVIGVEIS